MTDFDPTDFRQIQGSKWHEMLRDMGSAAGIESPYFRSHEIRAGAETRIGERDFINFASYDYLGLNTHPAVGEAAIDAVRRFGTSVSASRLVAGERPFHRELEDLLASVYDVDGAIAMVSGHATNVTTIGHLLNAPDLILHDGLVHNSIVMGARLSHATTIAFPHNDLDQLERLLLAERGKHKRCLIAVEGMYSMDGDIIELGRLVELKRRHNCWLMVDDAHGLGTLGPRGLGIHELTGVPGRDVDIWMGTLSKTLASAGGYIAGSAALIDYLRNSAPGFVYSVGMSPPASAAATAALRAMLAEPERVTALQAISARMKAGAERAGINTGTSYGSAIVPMYVGDSIKAMLWAEALYQEGINVLPIIYPAVPFDGALLRFFMTTEHTITQIDTALAIIERTYHAAMASDLNLQSLRQQSKRRAG